MVQLIVYGVMIAALIGGAMAIRSSIEHKGAARQAAIDKPIIEACQAAVKVEKAANDSLRGDVAKIGAERDAQSVAVTKLGTETAARLAASAAIAEFNKGKVAVLQSDGDAMRARLAQQPKAGVTCEKTLSTVDDVLRELAGRRVRDHPPARSGDKGGNPAADQGAGAGQVRVAP